MNPWPPQSTPKARPGVMNSTSALLASTHAVLPESICMALLYRREVAPDPDPSRMEERRFHPATPSLPPRERVLRAGETTPSCSTTRPGRRCTWSPSDRVRAVVAGSAPTVAVAALEHVRDGHEVVVRLRPHTPRRQWLRHPGLGLRRWRLGSRRRWRRWRGAPPRGSGRGGRGGVPRWARGRWLRASGTAAGIAGKRRGDRLDQRVREWPEARSRPLTGGGPGVRRPPRPRAAASRRRCRQRRGR